MPTEDTGRLLDDIAGALRRHVVLPDGAAETIALFVLHAHAHEVAQNSPILVVESPDSACGKTTLLRVLAAVTPDPLVTFNITDAGLYRSITARKRTLLIDEGELVLGNKALRAILNSGHSRDGACVVRADGVFDVFCPKVLALIGEPPLTLRNRSLSVCLQRKRPDEGIASLDGPALARLQALGERAVQWAGQQLDTLAGTNPDLPPTVTNRIADNWRALFAIADVAGGLWPDSARALAIRAAADTEIAVSPGVELIRDIRHVYAEEGTDRMATIDLISALVALEDRPWREWRRGRPITPRQLADVLRIWRIVPRTIRFPNETLKGYYLRDMRDAFDRYL